VSDIKERLRTRFLDTKNVLKDLLCHEASDYIATLEASVAANAVALNPRLWDENMNYAWHTNIPDVFKAFEALRNCVDTSAQEVG